MILYKKEIGQYRFLNTCNDIILNSQPHQHMEWISMSAELQMDPSPPEKFFMSLSFLHLMSEMPSNSSAKHTKILLMKVQSTQ